MRLEQADIIIIFEEAKAKKYIQSIKKHEAKIKYAYKYIPGVVARLPFKEIEKIVAYDCVKKVESD